MARNTCEKTDGFGPLLEVASSKNRTRVWREAHFQVKMGSCKFEKLHAAVARSTFPSQNVQTTSVLDHFLEKLHAAVARSTFQVKMLKTHMFGPLLAVASLKNCTPLWREAHFQVKMCKIPAFWTTFEGSDSQKQRQKDR